MIVAFAVLNSFEEHTAAGTVPDFTGFPLMNKQIVDHSQNDAKVILFTNIFSRNIR